MDIEGYYIAVATIYGLLLGGSIILGCIKKCFFPYIHIGMASVSGIITQTVIIQPIITYDDYNKAIPGYSIVRVIFLAIQYLSMFLIPIYVAHRRTGLIRGIKPKPKTIKVLVACGYFIAFVSFVLLIAALASVGSSSYYVSLDAFAYLYLVHIVIHWLLIILCFVIAGLLRNEIPSNGFFLAYIFFTMLMMIGMTISLFGGMITYSSFYAIGLVYIFLYHVCSFIGILFCAFSGPNWVRDIKSFENTETV